MPSAPRCSAEVFVTHFRVTVWLWPGGRSLAIRGDGSAPARIVHLDADADQVLAVRGLSRPAGRPARPRLSRGCSMCAHGAEATDPSTAARPERSIQPHSAEKPPGARGDVARGEPPAGLTASGGLPPAGHLLGGAPRGSCGPGPLDGFTVRGCDGRHYEPRPVVQPGRGLASGTPHQIGVLQPFQYPLSAWQSAVQ